MHRNTKLFADPENILGNNNGFEAGAGRYPVMGRGLP
jgi:hypothetical protein